LEFVVMLRDARREHSWPLTGLVALLCVAGAGPVAFAQDTDAPPKVARTVAVSPNATVNLVNLLVKQGVLTEEQAADLIKQAEQEAYVAREATKNAATKAQDAEKSANSAAAAVSPPGTKRVTYVPEIVKRELREDIRREVMDQAKTENWAAPNTFPEWVSRIRFYGDVRLRYEGDFFPSGNATNGSLINFNAINSGAPVAPTQGLLPVRDVDTDRERFRLLARLGLEADLSDGFTAGLRMATGDSSYPISTFATLGGGGGNFSKYPIWLDRGWLRYEMWDKNVVLSAGRFDNPFFSPTDLLWYNDLGFDGVALQAKHEIAPGFTPFLVAGAFPIYNSPSNYPNLGANNAAGVGADLPSAYKYLFGGQGGFGWQANPDVSVKVGASYFDFTNVQGQLSAPCSLLAVNDTTTVCSTDLLRPGFAQYGNTYTPLRNLVASAASGGVLYQLQYYGLASAFRVAELTGRLDLAYFNPAHIILDGTYVRNTAFDKTYVASVATNNLAASPNGVCCGPFNGGNQGFMGRLTVGYPVVARLWDWNVYAAYKYLESDATIDAFTDPDFGLGGTNLKGYIIGGRLGLGPNVWTTVKWMSANAIAGPPFAVDVLQVDLVGKF
jgi:hypothetical protein